MNAPFYSLPPSEFDRGRRTFLKTGIAGSALLFLGRWLPEARAAGEVAVQKLAFANLTAADAAALTRIIPVMLSGALPQVREQADVVVGEILHGIDVAIGYQPPIVRAEIRDLFGLLTKTILRALIVGIWGSWKNASDEDVRKFLANWHNSHLGMLRSAYIGLNNLIVGSWYGNPRSWPRIGYDGPPKIARGA